MEERSYQAVYQELSELMRSMEFDSIGIDELSNHLKSAYGLLDNLRGRLTQVEMQVQEVISVRSERGGQS